MYCANDRFELPRRFVRRLGQLRARTAVAMLLGLTLLGTSTFANDAAILVAPAELPAGGSSAVTVTTFDDESQDPISRPVAVHLKSLSGELTTLHEGNTDANGHLRVEFDVPAVESGSYQVQASIDGIADPIFIDTTLANSPAILIETDKPIYKPGQRLQGRIILLNNALRPTAGEVEVSIHDAKGIRLDRQNLTVSDFGAARFDLDIASEVNVGVWKVKARSDNVESIRDVRVEPYVLPRFELAVERDRSWVLVDEALQGSVNARYFFGKDVEGDVSIVAKRYVGQWEEYAISGGALENGSFSFELPAVEFVAGSPGNGGQGGITLEIDVTDSTGHTESTTELITVTSADLVLSLVPRSRILKPGTSIRPGPASCICIG
ncbi:MAG: MG2 domain-containing protein, partial [Planctomycetota bacterium]